MSIPASRESHERKPDDEFYTDWRMERWMMSSLFRNRLPRVLRDDGGDIAAIVKDWMEEQPVTTEDETSVMTTIPDLTARQRDLALLGYCPFCEEQIRGTWLYQEYLRGFSSEWIADSFHRSLESIDTGHRADCEHKEIRL